MATLLSDSIDVVQGGTFTLSTQTQTNNTDSGNIVIKGADKVASAGQGGNVVVVSGEPGSSGTAGEVKINSDVVCATRVGNTTASVDLTGSAITVNSILEVTQTDVTMLNGHAVFTPTALPLSDTVGTVAFSSDTNKLHIFDGSSWRTFGINTGNLLVFTNVPASVANSITLPAFEVLIQNSSYVTQTGSTDDIVVTLDGVDYTESAVAGVATFSTVVAPGTPGSYSLRAGPLAPGTITPTVPQNITVIDTIASKLRVGTLTQPGAEAEAGSVLTSFTVEILNTADVLVTSDNTTMVTVDGVSLTLGGTVTVQAVAGVATFSSVTAPEAAGTLTIRATSSPALNSDDSDTTISVVAAAASKLVFGTLTQTDAVTNTLLTPPFTVNVSDQYDNIVTSDSSTVITVSGDLTITGTLVVQAVSGVSTFSSVTLPSTAGTLTLTATGGGLTPGVSATSITISGPATKLQVGTLTQPGAEAVVGSLLTSFIVSVLDANNNLVTSDNTTMVTVKGVSLTLGGTLVLQAVAGVAMFTNVTAPETPGTLTIRAFTPVLTNDDSDTTISIVVDAASKLGFDPLVQTEASTSTTLTEFKVNILDQYDNIITDDSSTNITVSGNITITGTLTAQAVSGVSTFSSVTSPSTAGTLTLTATSTGLTSAVSSTSITINVPLPFPVDLIMENNDSPPPWHTVASSIFSTSTRAFNPFWYVQSFRVWTSQSGSYDAGGLYIGSNSLNSIPGEWLCIWNDVSDYYVNSYIVGISGATPAATDWTLLGSNSNVLPITDPSVTWTVIDTEDTTWQFVDQEKTFTLPSTAVFRRFAMVITRNGGGTSGEISRLTYLP